MGVVYRATQLSLERIVALKVIAPELTGDADFRERFKRESRLAASIEHPNVIPVYEAGEADEVLYLIMRFVDGTDMRALIDAEGTLEPGRAAAIVGQVAGALGAAHRRELIHRDVKPANVLIAGKGDAEHAYLTDFGIAREVQATGGLTKTGMVVGTLDYIAPERIQDGPGDGRSDVYALGCVLYEALTGSVPFPRDSDVPKMYAHLSEPPPSARDVRPDTPGQLSEIALRAMAKDPEERFATAGDMAVALTSATAPETDPAATLPLDAPTEPPAPPTVPAAPPTVPAEPPTVRAAPPAAPPAPPAPARGSRRAWPFVVGATALAGAAVGALLLLSGGDKESPSESSGQVVSDPAPSAEPLDPQALAPIDVGAGADGVAVGAGSVWVANKQRNTLTRIDPAGPSVAGTIQVGREPDSVAVGLGRVWVTNSTDNTVTLIDPATDEVKGSVPVGRDPEGVAVGKGFAWVANKADDTVTRIDADGSPRKAQRVGDEPIQITMTPEAPWVTLTAESAIARLDPKSGGPSGARVETGGAPRGIAYAAGLLWVSVTTADQIVVIDPKTERVVDRVKVPDNPREVRAGEDAVWLTSADAGSVTAIDPETRKVVGSVEVRGSPFGLAVGEGRAWAASLDEGLLTPIDPR
jgi:serine/threonine-protein kinase